MCLCSTNSNPKPYTLNPTKPHSSFAVRETAILPTYLYLISSAYHAFYRGTKRAKSCQCIGWDPGGRWGASAKGAAAKRKIGNGLSGGSALVRRAGRNAAQGRERGGSERERHVCAARLFQLPDGRHSTENTEGKEETGKRSGWRRHGRVSCFLSRPER